MALDVPIGVRSDGSWKVAFVSTLADATAPKIATEIKAAGSVDGSCLLTKGGIGLDNSVEKFKDERLCTIDVFEQIGSTTWTVNDLEFVIDPQGDTSATNKLYALIRDGWNGYLVLRMGKAADADWDPEDKVWVVPTAVGQAVPLPPEANTLLRAKASVTVTGPIQKDVSPAA
jgi:hypothetical protein